MQKPIMIENEKEFCCSKGHMLPVITIALDPKLSRNQRLLCTECLENADIDGKAVGLKKMIQLIEENQIKKMEKVETIIMNQIKLIESLHSIVDQMKSYLMQQLEQLITIIIGWIKNLQQQRLQFSQFSFFEELEIMVMKSNQPDSNLYIHEIQKINLCWTSKLNPKLEQFNQFDAYNQCKQHLLSLELDSKKYTENYQQLQTNIKIMNQEISSLNTKTNIQPLQNDQFINQSNIKPFNYQLIQECSIQQSDLCRAIAIDKGCSTLLVGCESLIKVFEFNQGMIKKIQTLKQHKDWVQTLNFMHKSKQFISGSCDHSIIIWKCNQNNQWSFKQILNGHNNSIQCLIINTNEDLIISGSGDNTIKFWINKNQWLCQQTIKEYSQSVLGLSLNQQQNRVVSCGYDYYILIIEQSEQNQEWRLIQKITIENYGFRVCFIDNNMFTFSPYNKEEISIFELNNNNKQFTKTKSIPIKSGQDVYARFPQQYINQKSILVCKNGEYVNLITKKENGEFLTEQSIHFEVDDLYGTMSDDGVYLITWDNKSKQIQIRRCKEQ
ncbi:unnamed protein product [Paramecium pentaurelia]|uniref:Uncharacterized protein n=1 Tax=Paramecium pentaurelia TaxID=43138 RepID=A0A8S1WFB0_9CILI|nr:unnamed protein product [Paramecium pentaurelia]